MNYIVANYLAAFVNSRQKIKLGREQRRILAILIKEGSLRGDSDSKTRAVADSLLKRGVAQKGTFMGSSVYKPMTEFYAEEQKRLETGQRNYKRIRERVLGSAMMVAGGKIEEVEILGASKKSVAEARIKGAELIERVPWNLIWTETEFNRRLASRIEHNNRRIERIKKENREIIEQAKTADFNGFNKR